MNPRLAVAFRNRIGFWRSDKEVEGITGACKMEQEGLIGIEKVSWDHFRGGRHQ